MRIIEIYNYSEIEESSLPESKALISKEQWDSDAPELHLIATDGNNNLIGCCSLWWAATPLYEKQRTGYIGHFSVSNEQAGCQLLEIACRYLTSFNCQIAIGPINGNTWKSYRFITDNGNYPPFFLEFPFQKVELSSFLNFGFKPLAQYESVLNTSLNWIDGKIEAASESLNNEGFSLRSLNRDEIDDELSKIYALSLKCFNDNFLYSPITLPSFLRLYAPIRTRLDPELILLIEYHTELVAYIFAIPDFSQAQRGEVIDTVIIKTLAVDPKYSGRRLGSWLSQTLYHRVQTKGFQKIIHALMIQNNISRKMHSEDSRIIRKYTLFSFNLNVKK